jgi:hypothetical protein
MKVTATDEEDPDVRKWIGLEAELSDIPQIIKETKCPVIVQHSNCDDPGSPLEIEIYNDYRE